MVVVLAACGTGVGAQTKPADAAGTNALPTYAIADWAAVPAAPTATAVTVTSVGSCTCDLTAGTCDGNCCCDADCTVRRHSPSPSPTTTPLPCTSFYSSTACKKTPPSAPLETFPFTKRASGRNLACARRARSHSPHTFKKVKINAFC